MKILFVVTTLFPGGAEKIVLETIRALRREDQKTAVASLQKKPPEKRRTVTNELEKLGVKTYFLNCSPWCPWRLLRLSRILRTERPDVVHAHLLHAILAMRFLRLFHQFVLVDTVHIAEKRRSLTVRFLLLLDRFTRNLGNIHTAVSTAAARFHEQRCGYPPGSIRVVENGSDPVTPAPMERQQTLRREWGVDGATKLIGSVGRLDFQKGYDLFLQSLASLRVLIPAGERWGVVLIGDGPEREKLRKIAAETERQVPELKIVLAGYRPDAPALTAMFNLFVMPSRYEGFGLTLTEALSCGVPCLCSPADSLEELCARAPENTLTADFSSPDLTEVYRRALALPRGKGIKLRSTTQMALDYLAIYREAVRR